MNSNSKSLTTRTPFKSKLHTLPLVIGAKCFVSKYKIVR